MEDKKADRIPHVNESGPENDMSEGEDDDSRSDHSRSEQRIKSSIDPDVLTRLKQGMPFVQEDFERSFPFHLFPPHMITTHLAAAAAAVKEKDGLHRERSPPLRGYPEETLPANQAPPSDSSTSSTSSQQTWSFEEQFKQTKKLRKRKQMEEIPHMC